MGAYEYCQCGHSEGLHDSISGCIAEKRIGGICKCMLVFEKGKGFVPVRIQSIGVYKNCFNCQRQTPHIKGRCIHCEKR